MKARKIEYIIAAGLVAAAMLSLTAASCTRIEKADGPQSRICYDVVQLHGTKAAEAYPTDRPFISWAFILPKGKSWTNYNDRTKESQVYIAGAKVQFDGSTNHWYDPSQSYYWPSAGSLTFFSYSPEAIKENTTVDSQSGISIKDWDVAANQNVDIMVADVQMEQTANSIVGTYTGVPTIFRHKLSQIVGFEFNTLKDYSASIKFYVTGISLNNIIQKGTYVSGAEVGTTATLMGKWTADVKAAKSNYNYFSGTVEVVYSTTEGKKLNPSTIMILPQKFSNPGETPDWATTPHLEISYKAGSEPKTARVSLYDLFSTHEIGMNKKITIKVTFSNEGNLITWAPDQDDWTESEFTVIM